jgi:hypothetical protein
MANIVRTVFPRRHNLNGTYDFICPRCFPTIGTATIEADLLSANLLSIVEPHACGGLRLSGMFDPANRR